MNLIFLLAQQAATMPAVDDSWLIAGFALFGVALVFFALEFVIPSGGLIATLCLLVVVAGIFCFFMHSATWGLASLTATLAGAPIAIGYGLKIWSNSPLARRVVLSQAIEDHPAAQGGAAARMAIGTLGIAETTLRPVGWIRIAANRHEALAEEGFIAAGQQVQITGFDDATPRVRAVESV
ncbi:MAG: hypothetical protein EXS12_02690 [Phycisphaerales bacterium]|nr:hypothetical protein [Phycisphaerales bacterium]